MMNKDTIIACQKAQIQARNEENAGLLSAIKRQNEKLSGVEILLKKMRAVKEKQYREWRSCLDQDFEIEAKFKRQAYDTICDTISSLEDIVQ